MKKKEPFSIRKRLQSFKYAFNGVRLLLMNEHNAWIHCFAAVCVIICGCLLGLSTVEWIAIVLAIGIVLAAEGLNSSIEVLADVVSPGYNESIKQAKDLAAGAVLIVSIAAAVIGLIIFIPKFSILLKGILE